MVINKKIFLFLICLSILISYLLISCENGNAIMYDAKTVPKIPEGFVSLIELNNRNDKVLRIILWENNIVFSLKEDNIFASTLYQDDLKNSDVIVKYDEEYYINEAKYLELAEIALIAIEERKRTYNLGETVEILGADKNYYVTITSVEETALNNKRIFYIKFTTTPDTTMEELKSIFSFAEITVGTRKGTGDLSNFFDAGTIRIEMKPDRKFDAVVLESPEYLGLTYRVLVEK